MKYFYIIGNASKPENKQYLYQMKEYIQHHGGICQLKEVSAFSQLKDPQGLKDMSENTECIMVLGGDGTLIRSANATEKMEIPLIGVNFGTMGYLCDIDESNIMQSIKQVMADDYFIEDRMRLEGYNIRGNKLKETMNALNDIVIYRYGNLRVVDYILYVNGQHLNTFSSDGIIISTPTGSTGYSMSCGGPIVDPAAKMLLITPISPHTLSTRSIVLNADDEIIVEIGERHLGQKESVIVSYDGETAAELDVGDRVVVRKSDKYTKLLKLRKQSFLETIRDKMQENN
ncbi:MAG: NAD(+)/NADH kinase [Lachnospiraceae bacterium]